MPRAQGANAMMYLTPETGYGVVAAGTKSRRVPFVSSDFGGERALVDDDTLGYGRGSLPASKGQLTVSGKIVVPLDVRSIGLWLKTAVGVPVSAAATAPGFFTHTFTCGAATLPSRTIRVLNPEVPHMRASSGLLIDTFGFPIKTDGTVSATLSAMARDETAFDGAQAVAPDCETDFGYRRFDAGDGEILLGETVLGEVEGGEFTFSNSLKEARSPRRDGVLDGIDPNRMTLKGKITVRFADTALYQTASAGDLVTMRFRYSTPDGFSLSATLGNLKLPEAKIEISGPDGITVPYDFQGSQPPGAADPMLKVVLTNDVETYA